MTKYVNLYDEQERAQAPAEETSDEASLVVTGLGYVPVNVAGDTMAGSLILDADPTVDLGAATKQYVDDNAGSTTAGGVSFTPAGTIAATDVQAALEEVDSEKAAAASAVMDGDAAGGDLAGTYPNPTLAAGVAASNLGYTPVNVAGDTMSGPLYQDGPVFDLEAFGAVGDDSTDDTSAIDDSLTAVASGGIVRGEIGKVYKTTGGHTIPKNVWIRDCTFDHTGNNSAFTYDGKDTGVGWSDDTVRGGLANCRIWGNSGSSAVGLEIKNSQHWVVRDTIIGDGATSSRRYTSGIGLLVHNDAYWNENLQLENVLLALNAVGIAYLRDGSGTNSLSYHRYRGLSITVPANAVGIDVGYTGTALLMLVGNLDVNFWMQGDNAVAIKVRSGSSIDQTTIVDFRGEVTGSYTGCKYLVNAGTFRPRGLIAFPYGTNQATVDLTGATATDLSGRGSIRDDRLNALGAIDETFPLEAAAANGAPPSQRLVVAARYFRAGQVITGIALPIITNPGTTTYAASAIYASGATPSLLADSGDIHTAVNGVAAGAKAVMAFTSSYLIPSDGIYQIGFLFVGGTSPSLPRCSAGGPGIAASLNGGPLRIRSQASQSSLPSTASFSAGD